jgi:hypothetical protein
MICINLLCITASLFTLAGSFLCFVLHFKYNYTAVVTVATLYLHEWHLTVNVVFCNLIGGHQ